MSQEPEQLRRPRATAQVPEAGDGTEPRRDPEAEARRAAALAFVRKLGDPVLKSRATPVDRFDDGLRNQVARMAALMADSSGVGLAAPQLGVSQRLFVYRLGRDAPLRAVVNPVLEWSGEESDALEEGCLSIPGVVVEVERPVHVRMRAQDETGAERLIEASGLEARVVQHELDHLDGILMLDRASREQRKEAMRILREGPEASSREAA